MTGPRVTPHVVWRIDLHLPGGPSMAEQFDVILIGIGPGGQAARHPVVNRARRDAGSRGALWSRRADGQPMPLPEPIDIPSTPGNDHDRSPLR